MEKRLLKELVNTNENVEYFGYIIKKTETQLFKNVYTYIKDFLKHHEEPLDVVHSECRINYSNREFWLSSIDLNDKDEIIVILSDESFSQEIEVKLILFNAKELFEIYWAVSNVIENILTK